MGCSHDIIHGDIKPENVVFATAEPDAPIVLLDFGLSKMLSGAPAPPGGAAAAAAATVPASPPAAAATAAAAGVGGGVSAKPSPNARAIQCSRREGTVSASPASASAGVAQRPCPGPARPGAARRGLAGSRLPLPGCLAASGKKHSLTVPDLGSKFPARYLCHCAGAAEVV